LINRVLIVGLGSMGMRHLRIARTLLPMADIRVLGREPSPVALNFAKGYFSSIDDAVDFRPQLSVIANPSPFHMQVAVPLASIGSHLLIEKPLAARLRELDLFLPMLKEKSPVVMTGYNLRFLPSLVKFREILDEGVVGKALSVRCEVGQYLPSWRPDADYRSGVSARKDLGGGALLELSHELDYLQWIFGSAIWVRATLRKQSDLEIDVEDTAHLTLGFRQKEELPELVATVSLDFVRRDTTRQCTVIGSEGSLRWNGISGVVEVICAGENAWTEVYRHQPERDFTYVAEWKHMLKCIEDKRPAKVSFDDGLKVLCLIDAAVRSDSAAGLQVCVG
jgi:predicted dehydrogenase